MSTIHLETRIRAPAERCFDLSRDVDLHAGSMSHTGERAVAGVTSGMMGLGDTVTWETRHFGSRLRLTTRITEFQPPRRFVDEQLRGPFASMRHVHEFTPAPAGTLMTDDFRYTVPFGRIGAIIDRLLLRRYMRKLLSTRNAYIKRIAESGEQAENP